VFLKSYIPRTLNEVYDPERDLEAIMKGAKTIYSGTIGTVDPKPEATVVPAEEGEEKPKVRFSAGVDPEDETQGSDESDEVGEGGEDESEPREKKPRGHRHEDKDTKKERKKAVKEGQREKRKVKMPKSEKKRRVKTTTNKR